MQGLIERISHLPSTAAGFAVGGVLVYAMNSWGCKLPSDWMTWGLGLAAALPAILYKKAA